MSIFISKLQTRIYYFNITVAWITQNIELYYIINHFIIQYQPPPIRPLLGLTRSPKWPAFSPARPEAFTGIFRAVLARHIAPESHLNATRRCHSQAVPKPQSHE